MNQIYNSSPGLFICVVIITAAVTIGVMMFMFLRHLKKAQPLENEYKIIVERMNNNKFDQMETAIDLNEERLEKKLKSIRGNVRLKMKNIFSVYSVCSATRDQITANLIEILTQASYENNFVDMLSTKNYTNYRGDLIAKMREEYIAMENSNRRIKCTITEYFPAVTEIEGFIIGFVDDFLNHIRHEVINMVKANKDICYKYKRDLADDKHWSAEIDQFIIRFQENLADLERRLISENVETERRTNSG